MEELDGVEYIDEFLEKLEIYHKEEIRRGKEIVKIKMFEWMIGKKEKVRKERIRICIATDLHYLSRSLTDYGSLFQTIIRQSDGKVTEYEEELLDAFVAQIKKEKPDVLILTGDLTFDGAILSHQGLREKLKKLREVGIQVYVFPGNHDICKKNDAYRFLGEQMYPEQGLTRESQIWLERQLKKAKKDSALCLSFSHQNLLCHNKMVSSGFLIENHKKIREILEKYEVPLHFSGHMHVQNIKRESNIAEIITSSLLISPNQYGVITIENQTISYEIEQVHVSEWAKRNQSRNPDLLDFSNYAKNFFFHTNLEALLEGVDTEEERELIQFFVDVNYAYYCGRSVQNAKREEMLTLWREKDEFIADYLESILNGMKEEHCKLICLIGQTT